MSTQENKAFVRRYLAALSGKDKPPAVVDQYVADSDEALKEHIAFAEAAFPRYDLIAQDMVAEGDLVTVRAVVKGSHQGDLMGIPPTGKQIEMPLIIIYRIAGGKIVEHWMVSDQLGMMQQLGVIPEPTAA